MVEKSDDLSFVGYITGLLSLVLSFFQPFPGLIFGIIGVVQNKKYKGELSKVGKKLSVWGIIVSIIVIIVMGITVFWTYKTGTKLQ